MCNLSCISVPPSASSLVKPSRGRGLADTTLPHNASSHCSPALERDGQLLHRGQRVPLSLCTPVRPLWLLRQTFLAYHCSRALVGARHGRKGKRGEGKWGPGKGGQLQKGLWAQSVQSCFGGSCSPSCGRKRPFHSDSGPSPAPAHIPGRVDRESVCQ